MKKIKCLICNSEKIQFKNQIITDGLMINIYYCEKCKKSFTKKYKLSEMIFINYEK